MHEFQNPIIAPLPPAVTAAAAVSLPRNAPLCFVCRYAPLSVRLVQASVRPGWTTAGEALKLLPGPCVEVTQDPDGPPMDLPAAGEDETETKMRDETFKNGKKCLLPYEYQQCSFWSLVRRGREYELLNEKMCVRTVPTVVVGL